MILDFFKWPNTILLHLLLNTLTSLFYIFSPHVKIHENQSLELFQQVTSSNSVREGKKSMIVLRKSESRALWRRKPSRCRWFHQTPEVVQASLEPVLRLRNCLQNLLCTRAVCVLSRVPVFSQVGSWEPPPPSQEGERNGYCKRRKEKCPEFPA